ncbi:LacI family DNA-binding transcriptional regulator [Paenibacillus rhizophilus]|uniref:LacI family transcriptional regulator n=1 Tax=Paenibacillus rhizophilus TaxID=1850366 RepID=A0A3N9P0E7_9BACL|nr:LacI family DNA-binding transcriptional regulator [Paenibacillus rhizophilus]RQW09668.1 LacI family transcriptional regulator [Paenibacillus rhizophilus]
MANIRDIAKATGFSVSTVSKALNGYSDINLKTKQLVLKTAQEMDYTPNVMARGLITKKSNMIGIFFGDQTNSGFDHPFFSEFLRSIKDVCGAEGYDILIFSNRKRESKSYKSICIENGVAGVILILTGDQRADQNIRALHETLPTVYIDSVPHQYFNVNMVESDNESAAFEATDYLIQLNHTRILKIAGDQIAKAAHDRVAGYKNALTKHNIPVDEQLIKYCEFSQEQSYKLTKSFFSKKTDVTAIFASSDTMAYGAIEALKELGYSVPGDISVIGFDDIDSAAGYSPALTTVRQQRLKIGQSAAKILINIIENNNDGSIQRVTVPAHLVIRESCGNRSV